MGDSLIPKVIERKPPDKYSKKHECYTVHIRSCEKSDGGIPKLKMAAKVFNYLKDKCVNLNKISKDIFRVDCIDMETANGLVTDQPFEGMSVFIPFISKYSVGVMRDIDKGLSDDELKQLFGEKVDRVQRMYRYNRDKNCREPTNSVKIFVECDELPEYITVYGLRCRVLPFEQRVKMCLKCLSYGHFEGHCKAEINKCKTCGGLCNNKCTKPMMCISCNSNEHSFGDELCPVKKLEVNIIKVMTNNKLSYFEAKDWIKTNVCADAFSCIIKKKDFPTIKESLRVREKKLNKVERNNKISLEIITSVNEIKYINKKNEDAQDMERSKRIQPKRPAIEEPLTTETVTQSSEEEEPVHKVNDGGKIKETNKTKSGIKKKKK